MCPLLSRKEQRPTVESHVHIDQQHSRSARKGQLGSVTGDAQYSVGALVGPGVGFNDGDSVEGLLVGLDVALGNGGPVVGSLVDGGFAVSLVGL